MNINHLKKFIDSGYSVIPVLETKQPAIKWKQYQTYQISKDEIERLHSKDYAKWGFCTGYNNLEVIDIDLKVLSSLKDQNDFWIEFVTMLKDNILDFDTKFIIYQTLSGGYHILFRCKEIGGNQKLAKLKGHNEAIIETRGRGGYVVIYEKQVSKLSYNDIQEVSLLDRNMVFNCAKYFNYIDQTLTVESKLKSEFTGTTTWDDYNSRTSIWDVISDDFEIIKKHKDKIIIRRHGASSPHSGYIYNDSGCMYLFTTGTIYQNEKLYSPFSAYCQKYHNGDLSEGAKELYKKGFGSRVIQKPKILDKIIQVPVIDAKFPIEVFPEDLQKYILECNSKLDSSIEYMGGSLLWLFSVIIGNSLKIEVKNGWVESVNIWLALVGKAGIGKTPSINNIIFPLNTINNREIKKYIKDYAKFSEFEKMSKEEKQRSEEIKKPIKSQFIVNDVTLEALVDLHEENKNSVGVFKDELNGFFKDMNKYRAGSDLEFWLSSWSNKGVSMNRKTAKSSFVESPIIPILGGIQPAILNQIYTEENKDNGFIDRMLVIFPELEVEKYNEEEIDQKMLTWYSDTIIELFYLFKKTVIELNEDGEIISKNVRFNKDANKEWVRIFNKITDLQNSNDENEYFKSMLPKQKSYIPRFSLIINTIKTCFTGEDYTVITKESVLGAEKLSDYFVSMAKKVKFDSIQKNEIKKVIKSKSDRPIKEQIKTIVEANPNVNKKELAEQLGISRSMLYRFIKE
jgi:hypothetical protein